GGWASCRSFRRPRRGPSLSKRRRGHASAAVAVSAAVAAVAAMASVAAVAAVVAAAVAAAARERAVRRSDDYVDAEARQVPQAAARSHKRDGSARQLGRFRRLRADGDGSYLDHFAPDRGGSPRDHAPCQARWQDLDPDL